jgi:hypothetical protein
LRIVEITKVLCECDISGAGHFDVRINLRRIAARAIPEHPLIYIAKT